MMLSTSPSHDAAPITDESGVEGITADIGGIAGFARDQFNLDLMREVAVEAGAQAAIDAEAEIDRGDVAPAADAGHGDLVAQGEPDGDIACRRAVDRLELKMIGPGYIGRVRLQVLVKEDRPILLRERQLEIEFPGRTDGNEHWAAVTGARGTAFSHHCHAAAALGGIELRLQHVEDEQKGRGDEAATEQIDHAQRERVTPHDLAFFVEVHGNTRSVR